MTDPVTPFSLRDAPALIERLLPVQKLSAEAYKEQMAGSGMYLGEADRCGVYVGLLGNDYGSEDQAGLSPTEREFDRATAAGKPRLIFVKGTNDAPRHPKMQALIRKAGQQLIRRRFGAVSELTAALYASLVDHLAAKGLVQDRPFEEQPCPDATLQDLDGRAVAAFVRQAREERQFPLTESAAMVEVLTHLNLLAAGQPTKAAVLLFGGNPQRFLPSAEVRCMHFHGTEIVRPVPFYRIFKGNLFEQVDMALDFVLSELDRSVGTRRESVRAPVRNELPPDVVREAIVNAVAHRDYASDAAVQVCVFADRLEVWNPGQLPPPLTPEKLRQPHSSIARNHRICEAFFLTRYIEKFGTGTLMMIRECLAHALPEPEFIQRAGEFVTAVWRDWLTEKVLSDLRLNERQRSAILHLKTYGTLSNPEYRRLHGVSKPTASRDLEELRKRGVLLRVGSTGKGTHYVLSHRGLTSGSMGSAGTKGSQWAQPAHALPKAPADKPALRRTSQVKQERKAAKQSRIALPARSSPGAKRAPKAPGSP